MAYTHGHYIRNTMKVILILAISFALMAIETALKPIVSVSGLLAIVSMACVLKIKSQLVYSRRVYQISFGKLWIAAEVILFVLVGAAIDIRYTLNAGLTAVLMIFALVIRSIGVFLCLIKTPLQWERTPALHHCLFA